MPTLAVTGVGTVLAVGDAASPEVFTAVTEVSNIGGPELAAEQVEVTSLDSAGGFKEFITGLKDGGSVSLESNWIKSDAMQVQMRDDVQAGTKRNYKITWSDSPPTVVDFNASVEQFSMNTEPDSPITASLTLKISGQPVWT